MDWITIQPAETYKGELLGLLQQENLPTNDLSGTLNNFFVALRGNDVVGTVGLELFSNYSLLRSLAVVSSARNKGIASQLLTYIEKNADIHHINSLYLLTETAQDYFARKGFHAIERKDVPQAVQQSSEFSYVCPQSAVVMMKNIKKTI